MRIDIHRIKSCLQYLSKLSTENGECNLPEGWYMMDDYSGQSTDIPSS